MPFSSYASEELIRINKLVNNAITYQISEGWDIVDGKGDCKSYSRTKFLILEKMGYSPKIVYGKLNGVAHVNVYVNGLLLDNNFAYPQESIDSFVKLFSFDRSGLYIDGVYAGNSQNILEIANL